MIKSGSVKTLLTRMRSTLRTRTGLVGLLLGVLLVATGLSIGSPEPHPVAALSAEPVTLELAIPPVQDSPAADSTEPGQTDAEISALEPSLSLKWEDVVVKPGQTLDAIFRSQGFSIPLLHEMLALNTDTKGLAKIRPGQILQFSRNDSGDFQAMRVAQDETQRVTIRQDEHGLRYDLELRQIERQINSASGTISDSLFLSGQRAGLSDQLIMKLANIFGWDIDFVLDIRRGDQFHLMYEKIYREGEFLRDGEILAASFINQGDTYQAVRYERDGQGEYYAPDGRNMRKAFLRAPLNFSYISSNFNPRRFHPILRRVKAHNGIDYRAPKGTPVYAAGMGKVIRSAYSNANGHHVFIQHGNNIVTKYLHFTKRTVKQGQRVRQGQVIGYVGATGLATAPHLHYEFVVNGVHRNPRTVKLPKAEPLPTLELQAFLAQAQPLLSQLSSLENQLLLADAE